MKNRQQRLDEIYEQALTTLVTYESEKEVELKRGMIFSMEPGIFFVRGWPIGAWGFPNKKRRRLKDEGFIRFHTSRVEAVDWQGSSGNG
jgi:hypothetical protein